MKKLSLLAVFFCLFLACAAFSQTDKTELKNFAGTWEFDAAKSKLPADLIIESGVLTVEQTKKKLTVTLELNRERRFRQPTPGEDDGAMGRSVPAGNGTIVYRLSGSEIAAGTAPPDEILRVSPVTHRAEIDSSGNLILTAIGKYEPQSNGLDFKVVENWEMLDDGETLKIRRDTETARETQTAEMYFTRKPVSSETETFTGTVVYGNETTAPTGSAQMQQTNMGVLNGKALKLALPAYPPAARAVRASGAVNVQVTIDEQGNVASASAVSGHPLLRAAAEDAARASTFSPTMLSGVPVKVTGVIVFNFVP